MNVGRACQQLAFTITRPSTAPLTQSLNYSLTHSLNHSLIQSPLTSSLSPRRKHNKAANDIQRVWRGNKKRIEIEPYLTLRRAFMVLRSAEESKRNSPYYHLLSLLGMAPSMASDTTLEKVLKGYPGYMHHVLEFCLQGNWTLACDLLNGTSVHVCDCARVCVTLTFPQSKYPATLHRHVTSTSIILHQPSINTLLTSYQRQFTNDTSTKLYQFLHQHSTNTPPEHNDYLRDNAIPSNAVLTYFSKRKVKRLIKAYKATLGLYLERHKTFAANKAQYLHAKGDKNTNATILKRLQEKFDKASKEFEKAKLAKDKVGINKLI
jgi:hypothetical protein